MSNTRKLSHSLHVQYMKHRHNSQSFSPKMHFLDILDIFSLEMDQITPDLLKMHSQHDSMPFFVLAQHFTTFCLGVQTNQNFRKVTYVFPPAELEYTVDRDANFNQRWWCQNWNKWTPLRPLEFAHESSNSRGVAILFRNGFDCKIIIKKKKWNKG